jgi:hypothetical protein
MQHGFSPLVGSIAGDLGILSSPVRRLFAAGDCGVSLFFVLSGFLITYLILNELRQTGRIDVAAFWIRRCLRIWPLYYIVVLFSVVLYPMMKDLIGYDRNIQIGNPLLYFIFLVLLCLLRPLVKPSRRQSVEASPVIEPRFFVALQTAIHIATNACRLVTAQQPIQ